MENVLPFKDESQWLFILQIPRWMLGAAKFEMKTAICGGCSVKGFGAYLYKYLKIKLKMFYKI